MDLHDRVALITGASGGLGAVTARLLAGHGVHIAVTHLGHRDEAADLCQQIEANGLLRPSKANLPDILERCA